MEEGAADDDGVAAVHGGHCGEGVDEPAHHPQAGGFAVVDGVEEAVLRRQHARGHAGVQREDDEGEEVGQGQGAADGGERGVARRDVVVPGDEADGAGDVDQGVEVVEEGEEGLVVGDEPLLERKLRPGEEGG